MDLIRRFDAQKKWIATVCVGALPVGRSEVLKGRKATTYHLRGAHKQKVLQDFGVIVVNDLLWYSFFIIIGETDFLS